MKKIFTVLILLLAVKALQAQSVNDSLLLYLPLNGNADDASGNGNNGIIHNATPAADRFDDPNSAYDFNGTDAYIEIAPSASLSKIYTSSEVTIAAWVNIRNWYDDWNVFAVFEQYDPATDWGSVLLEANWDAGGILFESGYNMNYIGCDYVWNFNEWHHLAVTYSKLTDTAKFYVDGNLICAKEYLEAFSPDTVNAYVIGRSLSGPDEYSNGIIDEVRIYNRALKASEISTLPTDTATNTNPTQIKDYALQPLRIFPNPSTERIYCKADRPFQDALLTVSDMFGKKLVHRAGLSGSSLELDIQSLPAGMYMLRISDHGNEYNQKFCKQ
jgi:hypothetical protein